MGDFEHLLLGIEMMFDRFLGNKHSFIKEKGKQKIKQSQSILTTPNQAKHKFVGNEIVSFVNSYYNHNENKENNDDHDDDLNGINHKIQNVNIMNKPPMNIKWDQQIKNDENKNITNLNAKNDENKEYMNQYRGKISSPISFRMRQQKRMMQSERRVTSRNASKNSSVELDFDQYQQIHQQTKLNINDNNNDSISINMSSSFEPEILSPFNVSKFAKTVDLISKDV